MKVRLWGYVSSSFTQGAIFLAPTLFSRRQDLYFCSHGPLELSFGLSHVQTEPSPLRTKHFTCIFKTPALIVGHGAEPGVPDAALSYSGL